MKGFSQILRGINGALELNRVNLFMGAAGFVFGSLVFQGWAMWRGDEFSIEAFCLAFGTGFAALGLGGAGAVAIKDRNVASATIISQTGAVPAPPPAGPPVPTPPPGGEPESEMA